MTNIKEFVKGNFLSLKDLKELQEKTAIILEEGELNPENPWGNESLEIPIKLSNGQERIYSPNKTSARILSESWGEETKSWINKKLKFDIVKQNVKGELKDVVYASPIN
jgi:hypothetical protein